MVDLNITNGDEENVVEEEVEPWPTNEIQKAVDATPRFDLRSRRTEIVTGLVKSFQVPRWENPEIFCEVSPIEPSVLAKQVAKREAKKKTHDDWITWAYCDVIAPAVTRVYAKFEETPDVDYSLRIGDETGPPTKVDHHLAKALGLSPEDSSASETFRHLFFTEGDVLEFASQVFAWSAVSGEEADQNF